MSDELEARLRAVEDRLEIIELEARYAHAFDAREGAAWSALFTDDGVYQSRPVGDEPPDTHVQGREALARFCTEAPFDGIHLLHLPLLTVHGDEATARIPLEFHGSWSADPGAPRLTMHGFYDVSYRRVEHRWLIGRRVTTAFSREQRTVLGYPAASALPTS